MTTNSLTSDEREEWLKQIRERRAKLLEQRPTLSWKVNPFDCLCDEACRPFMVNAPKDIDFLLSLLDSQAAGCSLCGGPHDFDTSIPSVVWNAVIRARDLPDYLCATCIVREFVRVGQGFTAELWNEEFNGVPIELIVNGQNAQDAALVQEENNSLRNQINDVAQSIVNEADKVAQLMQTVATRMREKCVEKVKGMRRSVVGVTEPQLQDAILRRNTILNEAVIELESLALDQVEQEKQ